MLVLDAAAIEARTSLTQVIDAVRASFESHARGTYPDPVRMDSNCERGEFHMKAGYAEGIFAVKANSGFYANPPQRPGIQGCLLVFDTEHGTPLAVLESGILTAMRTAAATRVALEALRPRVADISLIGSGRQAWMHAVALAPWASSFTVWGRSGGHDLARRIAVELEVGARVVDSAGEAARESEVVVTLTPSTAPLVAATDLAHAPLVLAVGADAPHKRELGPEALAGARVVTDVTALCLAAGELHHAVDEGALAPEDVWGELGDVLIGKVPVPEGLIVFDSTGTGFQDAAACAAVLAA